MNMLVVEMDSNSSFLTRIKVDGCTSINQRVLGRQQLIERLTRPAYHLMGAKDLPLTSVNDYASKPVQINSRSGSVNLDSSVLVFDRSSLGTILVTFQVRRFIVPIPYRIGIVVS